MSGICRDHFGVKHFIFQDRLRLLLLSEIKDCSVLGCESRYWFIGALSFFWAPGGRTRFTDPSAGSVVFFAFHPAVGNGATDQAW